MASSVVLTVSGTVPIGLAADLASGRRPRPDYHEMAAAFDAELVDYGVARAEAGWLTRLAGRFGGDNVLLALACWRRRRSRVAVFTDSENVGMLYAAISRFMRRRPRHVMIGHRLSPTKKVLFHRLLRLRAGIDRVVVYASQQRDVAVAKLGYRPDQVTLVPFMADTAFWRPDGLEVPVRQRPMIASAGQELRDYPTLIEAVRGLDVDLVVAAASPWSKRTDSSAGLDIPGNVTVTKLDHFALRQLYAEATLVVVPLQETDFQAGITTILEAMSMGLPVICTRTTGQTDTIVDGETGRYVPPGNVAALRDAIGALLEDRSAAARIGAAAREWSVTNADVERYAARLAALVRDTDQR